MAPRLQSASSVGGTYRKPLAPQAMGPARPHDRYRSPLRRTRVHVLCQERANVAGDYLEILLESEVARVKEMELKVLQVSLVGLSARRGKDLVLGSPDDQRRRLMLAQVRLPLSIERRVASLVVEPL